MADHTNHPHDPHGHEENPEVSWERKDVNIVQITGFGIGMLIAFLITVVAMWGLFEFLAKREDKVNPANPPAMMATKPTQPEGPRLQAQPLVEINQMHNNEEMLLNSYGWVDQSKGVARIPVDEAIDIVAKKGLPVKLSTQGGAHDGYRMIPSDASSGRTLEKISQ